MSKATKQAPDGEAAFDYRRTSVNILCPQGENPAPTLARTLTKPEVVAACVIEQWQPNTHDVNALVAELAAQVDAVNRGDLSRAEGMLIAQAHALNELFGSLARQAKSQDRLPQWEAYMRMAMKAQGQCRMTLETLAAIKNPPIVYAKQANFSNGGPQQVNNGAAQAESRTTPTKLLEEQHVQRLDFGATSQTSRTHSHLETLGSLDRPEDRKGEEAREPERISRRKAARGAQAQPGSASAPEALPSLRSMGGRRVSPLVQSKA